jgi:hypothetical protein
MVGLNQILKRQTSRFHYGSKVPTVTPIPKFICFLLYINMVVWTIHIHSLLYLLLKAACPFNECFIWFGPILSPFIVCTKAGEWVYSEYRMWLSFYYFLIVYLNCSDGVVCLDFHLNTVFMGLYFSYIVVVSFIAGWNRSTRRKPRTCRKSLTNFITSCCTCRH